MVTSPSLLGVSVRSGRIAYFTGRCPLYRAKAPSEAKCPVNWTFALHDFHSDLTLKFRVHTCWTCPCGPFRGRNQIWAGRSFGRGSVVVGGNVRTGYGESGTADKAVR